jgi:hypothetical protein
MKAQASRRHASASTSGTVRYIFHAVESPVATSARILIARFHAFVIPPGNGRINWAELRARPYKLHFSDTFILEINDTHVIENRSWSARRQFPPKFTGAV